MQCRTARYIFRDLAFLAVDAAEQIAVFTTGGIAPIPSSVLDHLDIIEPVEESLYSLPVLGESSLLLHLPRPDDYIDYARRGMFSYDWQDVHRTVFFSRSYEIVTQPNVVLLLKDLTEE